MVVPHMGNRGIKTATAFALALGIVALPPAGDTQSTRGRHPYTIPHVLRFSGAEDIVALNPHIAQQLVVGYLDRLTMAYLVRFDAANRPIPELATEVPTRENGDISADGKTITYHLRHDARWSDGVPFTAADVAFSVDVVKNPKNSEIGIDDFRRITRVDTPNPSTVVFHLSRPDAQFYTTFSTGGANPCILPKHILGGLDSIVTAPYNSLPVGIGLFKFSRWDRGQEVEMVADPLYFRGRPKLDKIIYKIIPDRNTVLTQMTTHELDLWMPVPAAYYDRLRSIPGIAVTKVPGYGYNHLDFNLKNPALRDPVVREALRYATNRTAILEKIRHGVGLLEESVIAPAHPFFNPGIARIPYDPAIADALLDADGWKRGADGIRVKNGVRLSFTYATGVGLPDSDQMIELIRVWWKEIGVEFQVQRYLSSIFFAPMSQGGILYSGRFDVTSFAWGGTPTGDQQSIFTCDHQPPNGQNIAHYCNPQVDRLVKTFETNNDEAVQKQSLQEIQAILAHDVPTVVLDSREDVFAFNSDLKNFRPNQVSVFDDVMDLDI
jgi:peptide/nickel transport system substrate-binding protein